jgi:hypothetical protein
MGVPTFQAMANAVMMRRCIGIAIRDGQWRQHPSEQCEADPWATLENRWAHEHRVSGVRARHGKGVWAISFFQGECVGPVPLCSMFSISEERACELLAELG